MSKHAHSEKPLYMRAGTRLNPFVVADANRCIGCRVCEIACASAHTKGDELLTMGNINSPIQPRLYLVRDGQMAVPVQCRHCEDAPCAQSCPVDAIRQVDGVILIDDNCCIGCKSCMMACPFGAIELMPLYDQGRPVIQHLPLDNDECKQAYFASKCDRCAHLEEPACIANCTRNALKIFQPENHKASRMVAAAKGLSQFAGNYSR